MFAGRVISMWIQRDPLDGTDFKSFTEVMTGMGVLETAQPKFVLAENLPQACQFVVSGNAELGFLALSQLIEGSFWEVPAERHQPIRQDAVILKRGADNTASQALLDDLKGEMARAIIAEYGHDL